jgi:hypothetical protein
MDIERQCPGCRKTYKVIGAEPPIGVGMVHNLRHKCGEMIMPVQGNSKIQCFKQKRDGTFEPSSTECFLDLADSAE